MPATKAPSASDSPACSVIHASPSVSSSRLRTNSSSLFLRATMREPPAHRARPDGRAAARAAPPPSARRRASAPVSSPAGPPSAGMTTSSGTTARSWNSSTPMTRRPCSLSSSSRSAISLTTIAVLLIASAPPSATAPCQSSAQARPVKASAAANSGVAGDRRGDGQADLAQAEAEHQRAHAHQLGQVELQPDDEHEEDDAELGQVAHAGRVAAPSASACGPISTPTAR